MERDLSNRGLEYFPLSLYKVRPMDFGDKTYELRNHVGKPKYKNVRKRDDLKLPESSLIGFGKQNRPKLLIWITMYNEPFIQLLQSLAGIFRAYYELVSLDEDFLNNVHIVIVADGYDKLDEEFLMKCEKAGIYNEFKTKKWRTVEVPAGSDKPKHVFRDLRFINKDTMNESRRVYGTNNIAHCFSKIVNFPELMNALPKNEALDFGIDRYYVNDFLLGSDQPGYVKEKKFRHIPMPIHFLIKHRNAGKIESHQWFFKGFCEYMNPKFWQIIDWGSIPMWNSISHIIMHMENFHMVGGAWGEIEVLIPEKKEDGQDLSFIESVLVRAQYVEYKLSHYLDKATETLFGFVSVLPGAFSTFRWKWINGKPLDKFLKGMKDEFGDLTKIMNWADANKYLAEDRIMWLEIISKPSCDYIIHYIPGAKCLTDPPLSLTQLIKQRRRWFNGSMFASIHVLKRMCSIWKRKSTSFVRNWAFMFLYLYMIIQMVLSFVIVGSFYGVFSIFLRAVLPSSDWITVESAANIIESIYLIFLFLVLLLSTTIEITWAETGYRIWSFFMGLFTLLMVANCIIFVFDGALISWSVLFVSIMLISFILPLVINISSLRICDFLKGWVYVIYLSPTYVNLFTIYAISNIHDVTWGSRPTEDSKANLFKEVEKKKGILYRDYRSLFLVFWCVCNLAVGYTLVDLYISGKGNIIFYIGLFLTSVLIFRIFLSTLHTIKAAYDRAMVRRYAKKKKSTVFEDVGKDEDLQSEWFTVFYDGEGNTALLKQSDPRARESAVPSSVLGNKVYRGFSLLEINKRHQISQGGYNDGMSAKGTKKYTEELKSYLIGSDDEEDELDEREEDDVVDSDSRLSQIYYKTESRNASNNPKTISKESSKNTLSLANLSNPSDGTTVQQNSKYS
jgi:cellulose synthase/poly-beta-1,6-N-acetylglucosamine synthase-like glycosyltransferase